LVYTTHSPFSINRNYPRTGYLLCEKAMAAKETQLVERTASRRYEPVRSGLGIDCAETIFMGSRNVVLEGLSDQRIIVAAIQKFGDPSRIDLLLDLNKNDIRFRRWCSKRSNTCRKISNGCGQAGQSLLYSWMATLLDSSQRRILKERKPGKRLRRHH